MFAGTDGTVHLTLFEGDHSFTYQGTDTIFISPGGYGEPVKYAVPAPKGMIDMPYHAAVTWMKIAAERWLAEYVGDES